ncbi:M48 family metallopeptidase [bacterium]|nr:M48 family metallopeptidase [bacterium]
MIKNNNYDNQYSLITDTNINVGSSSDLKDFFILIAWFVLAIAIFLFSFQHITNFYIDRMSVNTQTKIESIIGYQNKEENISDKYTQQIELLNKIQQKIIKNDNSIQHKQFFPIYVKEDKDINAWIYADGSIFFTSGLLDEKYNEQELAFILAHEIGHYSHKDHLKSISKQIAIMTLCLITGRNNELSSVVNSISTVDVIKHSKSQETKADLYAGEMLYKLYGTNQGGISAMKKIEEKEKMPEFLQYISDHPLTSTRIYLLEKQQNKFGTQ